MLEIAGGIILALVILALLPLIFELLGYVFMYILTIAAIFAIYFPVYWITKTINDAGHPLIASALLMAAISSPLVWFFVYAAKQRREDKAKAAELEKAKREESERKEMMRERMRIVRSHKGGKANAQ